MRIIQLSQGQVAIVDDDDSDLIDGGWYAKQDRHGFYAARGESTEYLHRTVMSRILCRLLLSDEQVDHVDGDKLNNLRENLRLATPNQNGYNRAIRSDNKSGYKGVSWNKISKKWRVVMKVDGVQKSFGYYDDVIDAAQEYDRAAIEYHGEYARLNFPTSKP